MKAIWKGVVIAESDDIVTVEGNHYFPADTVRREHLSFSNHRTRCAWKGECQWHSLFVDGELNPEAAWCYPDPLEAAENIRGRFAFWKGVQVTD